MKRRTTNRTARRTPAARPPDIPAMLAPVVAAFGRRKDVSVDRGWGAGEAVLKVSGKIFVMSHDGRVVLKLERQAVDDFVARGLGTRFDPRRDGRVMKEWLVVAPDDVDCVELASQAYEFVRAPAKPRSSPRGRRV